MDQVLTYNKETKLKANIEVEDLKIGFLQVLAEQPPDTWDSFPLFQILNDYLRTDGALTFVLPSDCCLDLFLILICCFFKKDFLRSSKFLTTTSEKYEKLLKKLI